MITALFAIFGALLGTLVARRRKGNRLDIAQYAAVYAIGFGILGTFLSILIMRLSA